MSFYHDDDDKDELVDFASFRHDAPEQYRHRSKDGTSGQNQ